MDCVLSLRAFLCLEPDVDLGVEGGKNALIAFFCVWDRVWGRMWCGCKWLNSLVSEKLLNKSLFCTDVSTIKKLWHLKLLCNGFFFFFFYSCNSKWLCRSSILSRPSQCYSFYSGVRSITGIMKCWKVCTARPKSSSRMAITNDAVEEGSR